MYEQAEPLYQRALHIREQQLGPDNPETVLTLTGLATLYHNQGKDEVAEPLYRRALSVCEQRLGPEHPQTVKIRTDYSRLFSQQSSATKQASEEQPE
jgi:hypothetical protein